MLRANMALYSSFLKRAASETIIDSFIASNTPSAATFKQKRHRVHPIFALIVTLLYGGALLNLFLKHINDIFSSLGISTCQQYRGFFGM